MKAFCANDGDLYLSDLWQLQGSHHSRKAKHVAQVALQLRRQLDGLVEQGRPLLCAPCTAEQVHCHHDRHGVEPERRRRGDSIKLSEWESMQSDRARCR